ncbi:prestin-like [Glandiceps talaboti]
MHHYIKNTCRNPPQDEKLCRKRKKLRLPVTSPRTLFAIYHSINVVQEEEEVYSYYQGWSACHGNTMNDKTGLDSECVELHQRATYHVSRPIYTDDEFKQGFLLPKKEEPSRCQQVGKYLTKQCACSTTCLKNFLFSKLPILEWLPKYQIRDDLLGDILAGFTVSVLNIPQSMAFAMLANMPPIYGLYTAFFPILVYAFFGTSRHMAFGTFGVVSLMAGGAVAKVIGPPPDEAPTMGGNDTALFYNMSNSTDDGFDYYSENIKANLALTFMIGIVQIILSILHMGFVTIYLPTPLIRGFTTGAACYIFTSQIKYLFGLSSYIPLYTGPFSLVYTYVDIIKNLPNSNYVEVIMAACFIVAIAIGKYLAEKYKEKLRFMMPIELLAVILGTLISYLMKLNEKHDVDIAGEIPTGIPPPSLPTSNYMSAMIGDAIAIGIVGFCVSISMATIFAKKHNYEVDANQEFLANGMANFISSFFHCFVSACSLARMLIVDSSGGNTQIAAFVNCIVILVVLLALGPLFEALPKAVLGSIVVVALKGMFKQCADLPVLWRTSKSDFWIWIVTFIGTVLLGVDIGLGVGVVFSILTVIIRSQRPKVSLSGNVKNTDLYRGLEDYKADDIEGVKIISFGSTLYYVNCEYFKKQVYKLTQVNPVSVLASRLKIQAQMKKQAQKGKKNGNVTEPPSEHSMKLKDANNDNSFAMDFMGSLHTIIIDCGLFNFIDLNGVNTLIQMTNDYQKIGVRVLLAACQDNVKTTLEKCGYFEQVKTDGVPLERVFVTVHDAMLYLQTTLQDKMD